MAEVTLRIENMHCGSCIRRVSRSLASVPGLQVKEVRVGAARFDSIQQPAPQQQIIALAVAALAKAGYPARQED